MNKTELEIKNKFSEWIAFSGTRSGSPLKARKDVYPLIRSVEYGKILKGNKKIEEKEFAEWHKYSSENMAKIRIEMPIGWTTKLINVYLKSMVYMANYGRPNLIELIHPPIDNGLWTGIKNSNYCRRKEIIKLTHSKTRIKGIKTYEDYERLIKGFKMIRDIEKIKLIEVEKYWEGTYKEKTR